jgi:hypothetical protein
LISFYCCKNSSDSNYSPRLFDKLSFLDDIILSTGGLKALSEIVPGGGLIALPEGLELIMIGLN